MLGCDLLRAAEHIAFGASICVELVQLHHRPECDEARKSRWRQKA
jgi:hypothetical protein